MYLFLVSWGGVRLSPLGKSATNCLLYQPRMIDGDECGAVGGMRIGRGSRSTRRKPAPAPLYPLQIPHDLTWVRTPAPAVGSRRLTVSAMARPRWNVWHAYREPRNEFQILVVKPDIKFVWKLRYGRTIIISVNNKKNSLWYG
jgi:hypothetical protein